MVNKDVLQAEVIVLAIVALVAVVGLVAALVVPATNLVGKAPEMCPAEKELIATGPLGNNILYWKGLCSTDDAELEKEHREYIYPETADDEFPTSYDGRALRDIIFDQPGPNDCRKYCEGGGCMGTYSSVGAWECVDLPAEQKKPLFSAPGRIRDPPTQDAKSKEEEKDWHYHQEVRTYACTCVPIETVDSTRIVTARKE